ncbi:peptidoglycan-binding domain-containing protein [Actinomycetes bacterium KLBMP 9797]
MSHQPSAPTAGRPQRTVRRHRVVTAVAVASAVLSLAGMGSARFVKSPQQVAAEASAPEASLITAPVTSQVLASTLIFRGTVGAASRVAVTPAVSTAAGGAAPVVSAVRVRAGQSVTAGQVLLEVSGRPLISLAGAVPAYRDLKPGDTGADVKQLQAALAALGHFRSAPDGRFGGTTKAAVTRLYTAIGYDVPTTGGPEGAEDRAALQAARDAVVAAERAVATLKRRIAAGDTTVAAGGEPLPEQLRYLERDLAKARDNEAYLKAHTGPRVPAAEVAFLPRFPARVETLGARAGAPVAAPLVTLSTGDLVVTSGLDPAQAELLAAGMPAQIDAEVLGESTTGTVHRVDPVTTDAAPPAGSPDPSGAAASGDEAPAGAPQAPVTVTPTTRLPAAWNGHDVRVTVTAAATTRPVLAVPVAAIATRADGTAVVTVVRGDGATTPVVVRAGVSADGLVEVTPTGGDLAAGDLVSVGR